MTESFHDVRLPEFISKNLNKTISFRNEIVKTYCNTEIRMIDNNIQYKYELPKNIMLSKSELLELQSFFINRRSKAFSFRLLDESDCKVENQFISDKTGEDNFQLIKIYNLEYGSIKKITKPVLNSVLIYINKTQVIDFTIDYKTGKIKLLRPLEQNEILTATFNFDIEVRFDIDSLSHEISPEGCYIIKELKLIEVAYENF